MKGDAQVIFQYKSTIIANHPSEILPPKEVSAQCVAQTHRIAREKQLCKDMCLGITAHLNPA